MPRNKSLLDNQMLQHKDIVNNPKNNIAPNRVRIIRLVNNMDIKELSQKLNISASMLQQIETQKKPLSVNVLILLSNIFDVSIDYILYRSDDIFVKNKNENLETDINKLKEYYEKGEIKC